MLNVRNLVVDSFKMIGEIGDQEALDGTRTLVGIQLLNELISQLNLDNYFAFTMQNHEYVVTEAKKDYTIGVPTTSADTTDINIDRPANITRLYIKSQGQESILGESMQVSLQDLPLFDNSSTSAPCAFAYQSTYPFSKLVFNSKPVVGQKIVMVFPKQLPQLTVNDVAEIPYEYEPALKYGLSYLLAKRYGNPPEVIADMKGLRDEAYTNIKENTQRKAGDILHVQSMISGRNIYNFNAGW